MSDRGSWNALFSHPASSVGCEISGWNVGRAKFRMWDIRVECRRSRIPDVRHPGGMSAEQLHPDSPRGHVARFPIRTSSGRSTRHSWTSHPDDSISYPDMLSGSLTNVSKPCYSPYSTALRWCVQTPCPNIFAKDSKELSSISDCFGDQKAIKTPKLNTIWLELIARVLNMLIGIKGDNYYSKVFKRVNYKLWNSTFWVVINDLVKYITF